jgi:hypothetical protein
LKPLTTTLNPHFIYSADLPENTQFFFVSLTNQAGKAFSTMQEVESYFTPLVYLTKYTDLQPKPIILSKLIYFPFLR